MVQSKSALYSCRAPLVCFSRKNRIQRARKNKKGIIALRTSCLHTFPAKMSFQRDLKQLASIYVAIRQKYLEHSEFLPPEWRCKTFGNEWYSSNCPITNDTLKCCYPGVNRDTSRYKEINYLKKSEWNGECPDTSVKIP
jgi:hypothetical protein